MGIRGLRSFFRDFLDRKKTIEVNADYDSGIEEASIQVFALNTVINLIANVLSSCEIRTFDGEKPVKKSLWYTLNELPNRNQTKAEFWREFWQRLMLYGEVLVIPRNGRLIIADGFTREDKVVIDTMFTGVTRDTYNFGTLFMSEVFYYKYSDTSARFVVNDVLSQYSRLISSSAKSVIADSGLKGTLEVSMQARGSPNFEEDFQKLMNEYFRRFFKNDNGVLPLFGGTKFTPLQAQNRTTSRAAEYKTLFDDALKRCAQAFGVSPALVSGDIAGIEEGLNYTLTACIDPLANGVSAMFTARNYEPEHIYSKGKYIKIDTSHIKHIDVLGMAGNIDKLISCGFSDIDEVRDMCGLYTFGEEWSRQHYITKNYDRIENVGGDESE